MHLVSLKPFLRTLMFSMDWANREKQHQQHFPCQTLHCTHPDDKQLHTAKDRAPFVVVNVLYEY